MVADKAIIARVLESYRVMLDFYGMQMQSIETGLLTRSQAERTSMERYRNLVRESLTDDVSQAILTARIGSSHNNLRISRILKSLSEFGLERFNAGFLLHVLNEQSEHDELNTGAIKASMDRWWANCIRNEEERAWIGKAIRKVRAGELEFTRSMYEQALESRKETGRLAFREREVVRDDSP